LRRIGNTLLAAWLAGSVGLFSACSGSNDSPVDLEPTDRTVSEICSPTDTVFCRNSHELIYEYRGTRVYGDMLLRELDVVLDLVESNLLLDEAVSFVDRPGHTLCRRLFYSTSGDVVAQTCGTWNQGDQCAGGRFFSFSRVGYTLVLLELGEWASPGSQANP
jgi:hypothetical protein